MFQNRLSERINDRKEWLVYLCAGLLFVGWIFNTPAGLLGKADAIGYAVCHRIPSHSYFIGDQPLPLCARCSGMYLGALSGIVFLGITGRRKAGLPSKKIFLILAIFTLIFIIDGVNSFVSLISASWQFYQPANWLRLTTGTMMGLSIAVVLFAAFNQTVWSKPVLQPVIDGVKSVSILFLIPVLLDLMVIFSPSSIRYLFALASVFGVILLLTMIYTMFLLMILKKENRITRYPQLMPYFVGGFGLTLVQIIILDSMRFLLTGTWEGFQIG